MFFNVVGEQRYFRNAQGKNTKTKAQVKSHFRTDSIRSHNYAADFAAVDLLSRLFVI